MPAHRLTFDPEGPSPRGSVPKRIGGVDDACVLFWSTVQSPDNPDAQDMCRRMGI